MSSCNTPDLVPSDKKIERFYKRNDLHIYLRGELFFGFRTGPDVHWGNLCSCMSTLIGFVVGYQYFFEARGDHIPKLIPWSMQSREPFGDCKAYNFLVSLEGYPSYLRQPREGELFFQHIELRPRIGSRGGTPSRTATPTSSLVTPYRSPSGLSTPVEGLPQQTHSGRPRTLSLEMTRTVQPVGQGTSGSGFLETETRDQRAARRSASIPSPVQNRSRASKAPERCWNIYKKCSISGSANLVEGDVRRPADIEVAHIFPHAYQEQWVKKQWPTFCTDRGPYGDCRHEFTGYHQICCLNNMIPLRVDIHRLWDAYEIGIDIRDNYRVISFSKGRTYLSSYHLDITHLDVEHRPLPDLILDHLAQCVYLCCLFPGSSYADRIQWCDLDSVAEAIEALPPKEKDSGDKATGYLPTHMESEELTKARAEINQYNLKDREHGKGKASFENYLNVALSIDAPWEW